MPADSRFSDKAALVLAVDLRRTTEVLFLVSTFHTLYLSDLLSLRSGDCMVASDIPLN